MGVLPKMSCAKRDFSGETPWILRGLFNLVDAKGDGGGAGKAQSGGSYVDCVGSVSRTTGGFKEGSGAAGGGTTCEAGQERGED